MHLAPRIEPAFASGAPAPTRHVLVYCQHMLAMPAQHCFLASPLARPNARFVRLTRVVAADARVELVAAEVLDGDDVEGRMPVGALRQWRHIEAVDGGRCWGDWHVAQRY
jgi:hypothetical protein